MWEDTKQFLGIVENITVYEELNYFKDLDQYKNRLLSIVTHDLRTPLTSINYLIDKSLAYSDDHQFKTYLNMAKVNADLLMNLINDIMDFSLLKQN